MNISVTNTFANGDVADATEVNENFQDIVDGLGDGSKDIDVANITCSSLDVNNSNLSIDNDTSTIAADKIYVHELHGRNGGLNITATPHMQGGAYMENTVYDTHNKASALHEKLRYVDEDGEVKGLAETKYLQPTTVQLTMGGVDEEVYVDCTFQRIGNMVYCAIPESTGATGNTTSFWLSGVPEELAPDGITQVLGNPQVLEGGIPVGACPVIESSSKLYFYFILANSSLEVLQIQKTGWSACQKKIYACTVSWMLPG